MATKYGVVEDLSKGEGSFRVRGDDAGRPSLRDRPQYYSSKREPLARSFSRSVSTGSIGPGRLGVPVPLQVRMCVQTT